MGGIYAECEVTGAGRKEARADYEPEQSS